MNRRTFLQTTGTIGVGLSIAGCTDSKTTTGEQISVDSPAIGDSDAPKLLAFEDLGCPHCATFHNQIYPSLKEDYIDTGEVQYVFTDFVLPANRFSSQAHQYAKGVQDVVGVDAFFDYIDYIFSNQSQLSVQFLQDGLSQVTTEQAQIDTIQSNADARKYQQAISRGSELASQYGVRGTPRFVLNGTVIENVSPYSAFSSGIDSRL